ncbi:MAG: hypothetical protein ACTSRS_18610 [Candidatus Helarchaeota archaeon]
MIDEKLEKIIKEFLDQELEKRIRTIHIELLQENFLTRAEFKEEMEKIHQRFDAMQKEMDRRFDAMQKEMDRRFGIVDRRLKRLWDRFDELSLDFGTIIEKIGYTFIKQMLENEGIDTFPYLRAHFIDQDHEVHARTTDVEIDLFSAEIPLIGECSLKIMEMDKLETFLRKIKFIERRYQKKFRRFLFTLSIPPSIEQQVKDFCEKWEIKLFIPQDA